MHTCLDLKSGSELEWVDDRHKDEGGDNDAKDLAEHGQVELRAL